MVSDEGATARARPVLVALDESTRDPRDGVGVYHIGESIFMTHEVFDRYGNEQVPTLAERLARSGQLEQRVLARHYCDMLGTAYDEMLVQGLSAKYEAEIQAEIDAAFAGLLADMPLRDRIWAAHVPTLKRLYGGYLALRFIHDRYFPEVEWDSPV
jgi:hypothetical protein